MSTTCEKCGAEITVSEWPFCPHGRGSFTNVPDDVPGGFTVENGFETPQTFYSRSAHLKALADRGMELRVKNAGPLDKIVPRWDSVDLEGAKQLVMRGSQARAEKQRLYEDFPITVETVRVK